MPRGLIIAAGEDVGIDGDHIPKDLWTLLRSAGVHRDGGHSPNRVPNGPEHRRVECDPS